MFINSISSNVDKKLGTMESLGNIDYYKRYVIIDDSDPTAKMQKITVINLSANTGKGIVGLFKQSERSQNTNLYHCYGNVIDRTRFICKPVDIINKNAFIYVDDISYGRHKYDLSKMRFNELQVGTSYVDMFTTDAIDEFNLIPDVRHYNAEHQMIQQDISDKQFHYGSAYVNNGDCIKIKNPVVLQLHEILDSHTQIIINKNKNAFNVDIHEDLKNDSALFQDLSEMEIDGLSLKDLSYLLIGPVTDLLVGLLFNDIKFRYDSVDGLSKIEYKTEHKVTTNSLYQEQIYTNCTSDFLVAMQYICEIVGWRFGLLVHSSITNLRMRLIKYDTHGGGFITEDFKFDIGKFRNDQHFDAIHWLDDSSMAV